MTTIRVALACDDHRNHDGDKGKRKHGESRQQYQSADDCRIKAQSTDFASQLVHQR